MTFAFRLCGQYSIDFPFTCCKLNDGADWENAKEDDVANWAECEKKNTAQFYSEVGDNADENFQNPDLCSGHSVINGCAPEVSVLSWASDWVNKEFYMGNSQFFCLPPGKMG